MDDPGTRPRFTERVGLSAVILWRLLRRVCVDVINHVDARARLRARAHACATLTSTMVNSFLGILTRYMYTGAYIYDRDVRIRILLEMIKLAS